MDKQKTQRIIGILVIIAFVIILIPLFFGKTDVSTQITSVKAPPLPGQQNDTATTLASADPTEGQTPSDSAIMGAAANNQPVAQAQGVAQQSDTSTLPAATDAVQTQADNSQAINPIANPASVSQANNLPENQKPAVNPIDNNSDTVNITADVANQVNSKTAPAPAEVNADGSIVPQPEDANAVAQPVRDVFAEKPEPKPTKIKKHRIITTEKSHHAKVKPVNLSSAEIEKLNSSAWAIQMGNFKDKNNARRLTDKLRVAGYKAFTKEIKSAKGNVSTRVYIGPEFKQASAVQLSTKVEQEMKMHGIVVSIKPLEL